MKGLRDSQCESSIYKVLADDTGQGTRLRQNYLRMRNQAEAPKTNRFTATPYCFTLKLTTGSASWCFVAECGGECGSA